MTPPTDRPSHTDRDRAESFGPIAADYDRYRPECPDDLLADLVALNPADVLDVGCGTGKLAVPLRRAGLDVLGVEIDPRMAAVARAHGVPVEVSGFETWDDAGRRFDLVTSGNAWHWIDPVHGAQRAAALLRPGGTLVRSWTYAVLDDDALALLDGVYAAHTGVHTHASAAVDEDRPEPPRRGFGVTETRVYRWELSFTTAQWVGLIATFSDHQLLPDAERAALLATLTTAIDAAGGVLRGRGEAVALFTPRV
ncbi:class I SAM-dependent methyltransferase [Cryptosporangium arvum]|uniref:class I SAM-dependent methyltransferase n=1 Tax=Cryptosporangium arvum TaxID=80871 RepID=UPI0004ADE21A|nr:class I SAM-dependent methyltransferase [Cryptosporangium arvum]